MSHSPDSGHLPGETDRSDPRSQDRGSPDFPGMPNFSWQRWLLILAAVVGVGMLMTFFVQPAPTEDLAFSEFLDQVEAGQVDSVTIAAEGQIQGELSDGSRFTSVVPTALDTEDVLDQLRNEDVTIEAEPPSGGFWEILISFAPFLLLIALFFFLFRRARGQMSQITGIGQSQAKMITRERPDTTFDDVAGYDGLKEEVHEIIDYLGRPDDYERLGARGPNGVLLIGPPGTGKTLLARAVAGEADVPFFSVAGSSFVEMLVGVGASRVRDLFEKARKHSPSIIFIDELDSVGRKRGGSATIGANNEQEQTLNQLLAEMDGFDPHEGVVVMAATNRPGMLDEALLRPGRFDRQLQVPLPQRPDRREILEVHAAGKPIAGDVELDVAARGTPGFSGADLENLVNEAAITAVRDERETITQDDFDQARDRIMLGRREESTVLRPSEQRRVAVHEAGHAIMAALGDEADPVAKVTILPTGQALGVTEQLPLDERRLHSETYLNDTLAVRLGGRAAELLVLEEASSGAANDLAGATKIAERMVRDFGFSEKLGPVGYSSGAQMGPGGGPNEPRNPLESRPYAEDTQRLVDEEVARILREAEQRALSQLERHRDELEELIVRLQEEETVDGEVVYDLLGLPVPESERMEEEGQEVAPHG